jgi:hypothetical protein
MRASLVALVAVSLAGWCRAAGADDRKPGPQAVLDAWLDDRSPKSGSGSAILKRLREAGVKDADLEALLRRGRATYPAAGDVLGKVTGPHALTCDHVDYATTYYLRVPKGYDAARAWPLVVIGHGGNAEMTQERAEAAAKDYLQAYAAGAPVDEVILAAPATARGWDWIGYSVVFTLISKLNREFHVDPDRVYATGQSMGGHMAWRLGIFFGDRFGGVAPMSGGYDFVANGQVAPLFNIAGYATHGSVEPYRIAEFNRLIRDYMTAHAYEWQVVEKNGGHEIFPDEVPKAFRYLLDRRRDLHRDRVAVWGGKRLRLDTSEPRKAGWPQGHVWNPARPITLDTFAWVRIGPTTADADQGEIQRAWVVRKSPTEVEVTSQHVRNLRLYLHESRFKLSAPLVVTVNGRRTTPTPKRDLAAMLELVKEFDDRGRVFHGYVDLDVRSDRPVPDPSKP